MLLDVTMVLALNILLFIHRPQLDFYYRFSVRYLGIIYAESYIDALRMN